MIAAEARADLYVDVGAGAGGDGQLATPFKRLTDAYTAVRDGNDTTIRVAAGTYNENIGSGTDLDGTGRKYTFLGGYKPGSGFATRDPAAYETIVQAADTTKPVFWFFNAPSVTIDGFSITNGKSGILATGWGSGRKVTVSHVHVYANGHPPTNVQDGGGLHLSGETVAISDSVIENNHGANFGGGINVEAEGGGTSTATVERNAIRANVGHGDQTHGGGLFFACSGAIRDNLVDGNSFASTDNGGAGGGIIVLGTGTVATVERNLVSNNNAFVEGGGIMIDEEATATLINNVVVRNRADRTGSGIEVDQGALPSHATLINNTIAFNVGAHGVDALYSPVIITNTIVWGHSAGDLGVEDTGTIAVSYSAFATGGTGVTVGAGDLQNDPQFLDATGGDYRLAVSSPLNDHGTATGAPAVDFAQNPRPQGSGVDIGAYEQSGSGSSDGSPWPTTHTDAGASAGGSGGGAGGSGGGPADGGGATSSGGCGCAIDDRGLGGLASILVAALLLGWARRRSDA